MVPSCSHRHTRLLSQSLHHSRSYHRGLTPMAQPPSPPMTTGEGHSTRGEQHRVELLQYHLHIYSTQHTHSLTLSLSLSLSLLSLSLSLSLSHTHTHTHTIQACRIDDLNGIKIMQSTCMAHGELTHALQCSSAACEQ